MAMDFFSAAADPSQPILHNDRPQENASDDFAGAIAHRFGSGALLTARLTPSVASARSAPSAPIVSLPLSNSRSPALSQPPASLSFSNVIPQHVRLWSDDSTALILDIRPHAAYSVARVPSAVSLSVPSTLLKRPLFSLDRLAEMLPSATARVRFSTWRSASRILVYDADSTHISGSSNIYGLLRKFKSDGFQGDLAWLHGGIQAIWRERRDFIDTHPPTPDPENEDGDEDVQKSSLVQPQSGVLRTRHLPLDAFSNSSSTVNASSSINPCNPMRGALVPGAIFPNSTQTMSQPAYNPFFDAVRQNIELSQGITERIPLRLPKRVRYRIHDLPFPWLREIASRAAKPISHNRSTIDSSSSEESDDDENITSVDIEEGKETLAMQFFKIEVAEQRRLMGIMEHHTKETVIVTSDTTTTTSSFPYSITAGVEKGAKNRYRNIWPFEHARVRLHQRREADDDYVNASYVQPLGTNKRYIATQGPLPATFTDFWTLCWEQNVHVIVMLTREVENSMTKCGSYWTESAYGPLRLRLISTIGALSPQDPLSLSASHQHMTSPSSQLHQQYSKSSHHKCKNAIIRRVFELAHSDYSEAPIRKIIHLQYLEWPDMNVPDDCRGILKLIKEVDNATTEISGLREKSSDISASGETKSATDEKYGVSEQALRGTCPVLLHCSAGVGRTGGFIAIDAVLDAVRAEFMSKRGSTEHAKNKDTMDVDVPIPINVSSVTSEKHPSASSRELTLKTASIIAGNGFKGLKQDLEGTDPEGSGSENRFKNRMASTTTASMSTRARAEDVSHHDYSTCNLSEHQNRPKTLESGPHLSSSSKRNLQLTLLSDSSSSSDHSLLDISGPNGHSGTIAANGEHPFPQSSFLTSVATVASPEHSPPKNESSNSKQDPQTEASSVLADHASVQSPSVQLRKSVDGGLKACARLKRGNGKNWSVPHLSGGYLRNRSPSPMARTMSGESATSLQRHCAKPSSNLRVPSFTVGFSSDAEPPSRSVSPSADEGSVVSQASSHDSLKYRKPLPERVAKSDQRENVHDLRFASVPERLNLPVTSPVASTGYGSVAATDLKPPRPLHCMVTPPPLSSFKNPIYEIIQDMRKQRMSLCQSLRQYIFVHAAILEGALMIVDEERQKEENRERAGETGGFKRGSERWEEAESLKVPTPKQSINESSGGCGDITRTEEPSRPYDDSNKEVHRAAAMSASTTISSTFIPSRAIRDEGVGYFSSFVSQPPLTFGLTADGNVDERALESVFSPRPRPQAGTFSSLQHHALLGVHFDRKRNNSPSNHIKDDITDLNDRFRRPSVKRKQPSGDAGEIAMKKRAQNESLSRECQREKEQRQAEGKMSNGTYARPRDGTIDILASGIVR